MDYTCNRYKIKENKIRYIVRPIKINDEMRKEKGVKFYEKNHDFVCGIGMFNFYGKCGRCKTKGYYV